MIFQVYIWQKGKYSDVLIVIELNPISHRGGLLWPRVFSAAYNTAFTKEVVNDTNWLLMYVHHRHFKKKFKALAGRGFVWRPSEVRGPLIFSIFPL